jgi:excinuclease ABC subunit B
MSHSKEEKREDGSTMRTTEIKLGFQISQRLSPTGDQPEAIAALTKGIFAGMKYQTLLGATGTGKTFTIANVIANVQRPTLLIAHNKTLTAQLCNELREFFPHNAVHYFVSYYDYYQPEAYIPQTDTYIEKDTAINDEIDRLRHAATSALLRRRDVIIVASVSCIYGLGSPEDYGAMSLTITQGEEQDRDELMHKLVILQYARNEIGFTRGTFRVRGDALEIIPVDEERVIRIEFFGNTIEQIFILNPVSGQLISQEEQVMIYPASHFISPQAKTQRAIATIKEELAERLEQLNREKKLLEMQRLEQRTRYDLEMIQEMGYCSGIENYSRHLDGRVAGEPPAVLIDYFPDDFLLVIDESHQTIPQIRAMYHGDRSRKETLVDFGFRLPSALDNRPLTFSEFEARINQVIFTSATPGPYEYRYSSQIVEQIIRPTGLVDPMIEVHPIENQIDHLINEIELVTTRGERVLVTTLTKRMAEDLTEYLVDIGKEARYLHSEIDTLDRIEILRDLRTGKFTILVGINLLREGLDLPEVSLVAILDADKTGFLRSATSLIQTIGRASRNVNGKVILYADQITDAIRSAIDETNRRRAIQIAYNKKHGIIPQTIEREITDILQGLSSQTVRSPQSYYHHGTSSGKADEERLSGAALQKRIAALQNEMRQAAQQLEFELAATLRDKIKELKERL